MCFCFAVCLFVVIVIVIVIVIVLIIIVVAIVVVIVVVIVIVIVILMVIVFIITDVAIVLDFSLFARWFTLFVCSFKSCSVCRECLCQFVVLSFSFALFMS